MDDRLSLAGRAAIVTGAGNGLGRAEALALAAAGAGLVLNDLAGDDVCAVADEVTAAGGQAVVCAGDIGEWATGEQLVAAALEHYGQLDILVNNAGVLRDRMVFTMSEQEWDLVLRVHLRGHFVTTRFAEPAEISRLVVFLASDESSYSTGSEFVADGGLLSGPGY